MRISIIGSTGSGKTMLAKHISSKFSIPHIQLDRFWFEEGGKLNQSPEESRVVAARIRARILSTIQSPDWVSDGTYRKIQDDIAETADQVVWLDIPFIERLANHFIRIHRRRDRHPEVGYFGDWKYFGEMFRRQIKNDREKSQDVARRYAEKAVILHSRRDVRNYITHLERD